MFRQSLAYLWNVEQDAKLAEMKHNQIYGLSFSADGKTLQATITVDDPGAFNTPWSAVQRWRRRDGRAIAEVVCAENSAGYFSYDVKPIPTAAKPDF